MEAIWLLISLRERGFTVQPKDGKLFVGPAEKLTGKDIAAIKQHRDEILSYLECPEAYAMAFRAEGDEPPWTEEPTPDTVPFVLRESVIVREPGWPVMAFSPEFFDAIAAWNREVDERNARAAARDAAKAAEVVRKGKKAKDAKLD